MNTRTRLIVVATAIIMILLLGAMPAMAKSKDKNKNKIPDTWEKKYHLSLKVNQAKKDFDKDGLKNIDEYRCATNPRKKDTDKDGILDGQEDRDRDGLVNLAEIKYKTNPAVADTNDNGVKDGNEDVDDDGLGSAEEFALGLDPTDADTDVDGVLDGEEITGFVTGFDPSNGILTVASLSDGDRNYTIQVDADTVVSWADVISNDTDATLDDLKPGVMISSADVDVDDPEEKVWDWGILVDGQEVEGGAAMHAGDLKIMPAGAASAPIATIKLFDDVEGRMTLSAAGFKNCEYEMFVDANTQYQWAAGMSAGHDASASDLAAGASIAALQNAYTPDGELLALTVVLIP